MTSSTPKINTDFRLCAKCSKIHSLLNTCPACSEPLSLVDHTFFLGKNLGRYTIDKVLGAGGMGIVFLGVHQALGKKVAVKIFIPASGNHSDDQAFEKRFLREARILADLSHPNIVDVFDFDISGWGTPYYVMEYLEGQTLRQVIDRNPLGVPHQWFEVFLEPVIHGLEYAHSKGIVHRDLKPENIFIVESHGKEVMKILDFGIAKSIGGNAHGTGNLTATQTVLGTPYYIAPEQILNKNIGPHTDQYALALILAEMLSGKTIRAGKNVGEILYTEVHKPIQLDDSVPDRVPAAANDVLVKATMPQPDDRFSDIATFGRTILASLGDDAEAMGLVTRNLSGNQTMVAGRHKTIKTDNTPTPKNKKTKKNLLWPMAAIVAVMATVLFVVFSGGGDKTETGPTPPPKKSTNLEPKHTVATSSPLKSFPAPPDAVALLTRQDDTLVVRGVGGIYFVETTKNEPFSKIPLEETILRGMSGGNIAFIDDYTITSRNFLKGTDAVLVRNPPTGDMVKMNPSGTFLAVKKHAGLTLSRVDNQKLHTTKRFALETKGKDFDMALGDRFLLFSDGGRIRAYRLEKNGVKETLNLAFGVTKFSVVAFQAGGDLVAVSGGDDKIHVFDLATATAAQVIAGGGTVLAMEFLPAKPKPVLVVSRRGKLVFRQVPGKIMARYEAPGINIVDIAPTAQGIAALDKGSDKIDIFSPKL